MPIRRRRRSAIHANTMNLRLFLSASAALAAGAALLLPICARAEPPPAPLTAAVFSFQASGENLEAKGAEVATLLNAQLSSVAPEVSLVERQEIDKVLGEQELGLSGTVSSDTAAKTGALLGAKVLITGRLFEAGGKYYLVAKIIGTDTGRVYGESETFADLSGMEKAAGALALKIADDFKKRGGTLVAAPEPPGARLERLRKIVAGKGALPSVSVVIAEQHLGRVVIDPAAQTEIKFLLEQLGFEVIDPAANGRQADVQVTGEAFSELAGRHGNLVSCRARVEIRAVRPAGGRLLLADAQTDVAVDVAEHVAGKSALENAAAKLTERLLPKLVEP
jgi:hypothetical protein